MYSPSKRRFKRVISMNAIRQSPDANLLTEKDNPLNDDSEYSDWNGFSSDSGSSKDGSSSKRVISMNTTRESPDINLLMNNPLNDDSEYSDWNEFSGDSESLKDAFLNSSQSLIDVNEETSVEVDDGRESLIELPLRMSIKWRCDLFK